jgi:hypothetical protein
MRQINICYRSLARLIRPGTCGWIPPAATLGKT